MEYYQTHPKVLRNYQFGPLSLTPFGNCQLLLLFIFFFSPFTPEFFFSLSLTSGSLSLISATLMADHLSNSILTSLPPQVVVLLVALLSPCSSLSIPQIGALPSFCLSDLELSLETKHQPWPSLHDSISD